MGAVSVDTPAPDVGRLTQLVRDLVERNRQLEHALQSRIVIEQAKGVLAERLGMGPDEAFEVLRRAARRNRMRIHDLAHAVVSSRETPDVLLTHRPA
jgi:AmiR/NasT family two-component response regulator